MSLFLAIASIIQAAASDTLATRNDLLFCRAVEEFAGADPPDPYRGLFRRMGADQYRERDAASRECLAILAGERRDIRWLMVGRRDRDPEIRLRCNALIRGLTPCQQCGGDGRQGEQYTYECWDCGGAGTAWPFGPFD